MTTQFHALRLHSAINEQVLKLAQHNNVDLNSVQKWTDTMYIIGESKCGLEIHIRQHDEVSHMSEMTPAGVYVTLFNEAGNTIEHVNIEGVTL